MLSLLAVVLGAAMVSLGLADMYVTAVAAESGGGPVTRAIANGLQGAAQRLAGGDVHRRLRQAGNTILVGVAAAWLLLIWGGFALIFLSEPASVVDSLTEQPVGVTAKLAYVAGGLAGAGARLIAGSGGWEALNNLAAILGLVWAALTVTYLLQAVLAASEERALASRILTTAGDPIAMAALGAGQDDLGVLGREARDMTPQIAKMARLHHALPVLPYLHADQRHISIEVAIAVLDEALMIATAQTPSAARSVHPTRAAIGQFISTVDAGERRPSPPLPSLEDPRASDLSIDREALRRHAEGDGDRRHRLRALVENRGWDWERDVLCGPA